MPIDIERARRDTPGASQVLHFNNAGAALMPAPVLRGVSSRHLQLEAEIGGYEAAAAADDRDRGASTIRSRGCSTADRDGDRAGRERHPRPGTWRSIRIRFAAGDRILTAEAEYASNYIAFLQVARRTGAVVEVVPSDEHGQSRRRGAGDA